MSGLPANALRIYFIASMLRSGSPPNNDIVSSCSWICLNLIAEMNLATSSFEASLSHLSTQQNSQDLLQESARKIS